MDHALPDKLFYKIGEISKALSLNSSVLRFWETEFSQLKPRKSPSGQRLYSRNDLELLIKIRKLLYRDKLTIEGARRAISGLTSPPLTEEPEPDKASEPSKELLQEIREELLTCRHILNS
jgi:DNA-binding transcriptional MerR regulator